MPTPEQQQYIKAPLNPELLVPFTPTPTPTPTVTPTPTPTPTPTVDTNLENIRKVFGQEWVPSPTFTPEMQKQGVYGAVRIAGTPSVYTIGSGGKELTADEYKQQFGTLSQQGIVGEVTEDQASKLGIVLPTKKSEQDQPETPAFTSSEESRTEEKSLMDELKDMLAKSQDNTGAKQATDDIIAETDKQISALEKRRAEETKLINEQFDILSRQQEEEQYKEVGTTTSTLARIGGFLGQSASSQGAMLNLAQSHRNEETVLEAKRSSALQAANNAITDKQFELARSKVTEAKELNNEIEKRRNNFFDQTMDIVQENRQQNQEKRVQDKYVYDSAIDTIETTLPTIMDELTGKTRAEIEDTLIKRAGELRVDPNLLIGKYYAQLQKEKERTQNEIVSLVTKYPSAGIDPNTDTFATASEKVRNSKEYKSDIAKAEADLANTYSLIKERATGGKQTIEEIKITRMSNASQAFEEVKGTDGFISPSDWIILRNTWLQQGGILKDFVDNFSIYQNPTNTY